MKKRVLVFCVLVISIMCLFAITASADETIGGLVYTFSGSTARLTSANQSYALDTAIVPKEVTNSNGTTYTVTEVYKQAFQNNKNIKYVSLPSTITFIGQQAFAGCSNLVFVDFNDNKNTMNWGGCGVFDGCSSLKAISLPDGLSIIPDQTFRRCKALTAVYLPSTLTRISGNKSSGDGPAFGYNPNMFFVNNAFEVRDGDGNFYTAESFKVPTKPEVYYFPSTLKFLCSPHNINSQFTMDENGMATNTSGEDCGIYECTNLNSVLVVPESFQGYDDRVVSGGNAQVTDHRGDTLSSGLFQNCGSQANPLTVVFLGKINRVSMARTNDLSKYTTYVFANEGNTGFENTKIGTWYDASKTDYSTQPEMYVVFCHANNGAGAKYKVKFAGQEGNSKYPVLTSELQENAVVHMVSPNKNVVASEATCLVGTVVNTFCFCGAEIDVNKELEGTALGHEFDLADGATPVGARYENYVENGFLIIECARCKEETNEQKTLSPIISRIKGYATSEDGKEITFGYDIDKDALEYYNELADSALELGFVVAVNAYLDGAPLNSNGTEATLAKGKVVKTVTNAVYSSVDFRLTGKWDNNVTIGDEETQLKYVELFIAGYIFDGTVNYVNEGGSSTDYTTVVSVTHTNKPVEA